MSKPTRRTRVTKREGVVSDNGAPLGEPTPRIHSSPLATSTHGTTDDGAPVPSVVAKGTISSGALAGGGKLPPARNGAPKWIRKDDGPVCATVEWRGLTLAIECMGGDVRHPEGPHPTLIPLGMAYGFVEGVPAEDGDSLDVILGPSFGDEEAAPLVYLAAQCAPSRPVSVEPELAKAEWTTAYVNDLPDSAFLYISPGGEKDAENKTTPRSLRHLPYRDADGRVDLAHLRNALARIPQANIPESAKEDAKRTASKLLANVKKGLVGSGAFAQFKVMIGFESEAQAEGAFKLLWPAMMFGGIYAVPIDSFVELVLPKLIANKALDVAKVAKAERPAVDLWLDVERASIDTLARAHHAVHVAVAKAEIDVDDAANLHARIVDELADRAQLHPAPPDLDLDPISADLEKNVTARRSFDPPLVELGRAPVVVEKRGVKPFRSPGGKDVWVPLLKSMSPTHSVFVEPYAGSASFFFGKEPSEKEVLVDVNPEIIATYRFLKTASDDDFAWIRAQRWDWSPRNFAALREQDVEKLSPRERAYRYKYLNLYSARGRGEKIDESSRARVYSGKGFLRNLEKFRDRLKNTELVEGDALETMAKYDSPETFHYIDPPWRPEARGKEWKGFDVEKFTNTVRALKGRALVSYQGDLDLPGFHKETVSRPQGGIAGMSHQQLFWNYDTDAVVKAGGRTFVPPEAVRSAAKRAIEWREKFGRGMTEVGARRARGLMNGRGHSLDELVEIAAYFERHEVDSNAKGSKSDGFWRDDENPSAGWIAWNGWGGDAGRKWANGIVDAHEKDAKKAEALSSELTYPALRAAPTVTRTIELSGPPEIVDRVERLLAITQYLGAVGASRLVRFGVDGDGADRLAVKGLAHELDSEAANDLIEDDEFSVSAVPWKEKRSKRASISKARFTLHEHWNGTEAHTVLRIEKSANECESWALDTGLKAAAAVTHVSKAAGVDGVAPLQGAMRARPLPPSPRSWLDLEGTSRVLGVEKSASGAPSVFRVSDTGEAEFGLVRDDVREVFLKGERVRRRLLLRKVALEAGEATACAKCGGAPEVIVKWAQGWAQTPVCKACHPGWFAELTKAAVDRELPGVVETVPYEEKALEAGVVVAKGLGPMNASTAAWVALWHADPTPVVLRKGAAFDAPVGVPGVPSGVAAQVPEGQRWWFKEGPEAAELRAAFASSGYDVRKALGGETGGDRFALQKSEAGGEERWTLHVAREDGVVSLELAGDPRITTTRARIAKCETPAVFGAEGELGRAHRANTTGAPIRVTKADAGEAEVVVNEDDFVRVVLKGEHMRGVYELEADAGEWTLTRRGDTPSNVSVLKCDAVASLRIEVRKADEEKRLATGIVAEPDSKDAHGDFQREATIERAAHRFMARLNRGTGLGIQHSIFGEVGVELVESWIAREDTTINGQPVKKGSWLMTVRVLSDKLWQKIKRGEITGFSFGGDATVLADA